MLLKADVCGIFLFFPLQRVTALNAGPGVCISSKISGGSRLRPGGVAGSCVLSVTAGGGIAVAYAQMPTPHIMVDSLLLVSLCDEKLSPGLFLSFHHTDDLCSVILPCLNHREACALAGEAVRMHIFRTWECLTFQILIRASSSDSGKRNSVP